MGSVKTLNTTRREPHPWFSLLLVVVTVFVAFGLPSLWPDHNPLLLESIPAFASLTVFIIYTAIYGSALPAARHRGLFPILILMSPWLFAAMNVWGKLIPSNIATPAALTALLTAFAIGVSEELLFRGILFRAFQGRSMVLYVLINSIVFGLFHYQQGIEGVLVTAIVGSSYSLARVAGAPLILLIVCHTMTNFPNLFPHTPHPQYSLVAFVVIVLVIGLALFFVFRRKEFTIQRSQNLPSL